MDAGPERRRRERGSLYVTTSRRTPAAVVEALAAALPAERAPLPLGRRRRQSLPRAARARRPVHRHRRQHLDDGRGGEAGQAARHLHAARGASRLRLRSALGRRLAALEDGRAGRPRTAVGRAAPAAHRQIRPRPVRDPPPPLCAGLAVPLGQPFRPPQARPSDDLARAVERVRALMARRRAAEPVAQGCAAPCIDRGFRRRSRPTDAPRGRARRRRARRPGEHPPRGRGLSHRSSRGAPAARLTPLLRALQYRAACSSIAFGGGCSRWRRDARAGARERVR